MLHVLIGHPQHIIIRGNNREPIFHTEQDYQFKLEKPAQSIVVNCMRMY